ncbi:MAG: prephenate dehydrogenase [Campylobacterota bacterium]|nr:prephenate dehydrogenase [Campylobacterota bacterium]
MENFKKLKFGIVGLGLMGGSFAKVVKKYNLASEVVGYDHNKQHEDQAIALGLVERVVDIDELLNCDIIILCIPVDAIVSFMPTLENIDKDTTIVDFGSTKKLIVDNIPESIKNNFVPAHPMTGTEKFGPFAAVDGLYEGKTIVLCDLDQCDELHKQRSLDIFNAIAMRIVHMDSSIHDLHACYISHLPHAISFGLANTVMSHEDPQNIMTLAAGGFKDMSRIAKSSPNMWTDIFRQNRENLLESLTRYEEHMQDMKKMLEEENYEEIHKWMVKANTLHDIL